MPKSFVVKFEYFVHKQPPYFLFKKMKLMTKELFIHIGVICCRIKRFLSCFLNGLMVVTCFKTLNSDS